MAFEVFSYTLLSTFAQLVSKVDQICLLKIRLYLTLRIFVLTHTLGKINFLLCFAYYFYGWSWYKIWVEYSQGVKLVKKLKNIYNFSSETWLFSIFFGIQDLILTLSIHVYKRNFPAAPRWLNHDWIRRMKLNNVIWEFYKLKEYIDWEVRENMIFDLSYLTDQ